jgi:hypothetical protein
MTRALPRALSAVLLASTLALTGCSDMQSGDSNPDNQIDQAPGVEGGDVLDEEGDQGSQDDQGSDDADDESS